MAEEQRDYGSQCLYVTLPLLLQTWRIECTRIALRQSAAGVESDEAQLRTGAMKLGEVDAEREGRGELLRFVSPDLFWCVDDEFCPQLFLLFRQESNSLSRRNEKDEEAIVE